MIIEKSYNDVGPYGIFNMLINFRKGSFIMRNEFQFQTAAGKKSFSGGVFMFLSVLLLITAVFSSGCQTCTIGVSGVSQENFKLQANSTFVVVARCDKKIVDKQNSQRLKRMAEVMLAKRGLVLVENKDAADTVVVVYCDISAPQKRTRTEYVSKPCPVTFDYGVGPYDDDEFAVEQWNQCEQPVEVNYVVYTKSLIMRGFLGKKHSGNARQPKQLWRVEARDTDEVSNFKTVMPYLVIAAAKYAGDTTSGFKIVKIPEDGKQARQLKEAAEE